MEEARNDEWVIEAFNQNNQRSWRISFPILRWPVCHKQVLWFAAQRWFATYIVGILGMTCENHSSREWHSFLRTARRMLHFRVKQILNLSNTLTQCHGVSWFAAQWGFSTYIIGILGMTCKNHSSRDWHSLLRTAGKISISRLSRFLIYQISFIFSR